MNLAQTVADHSHWLRAMRAPGEAHQDDTIGAILFETGRLSLENAERIRRLQREEGLAFGAAGIALGLLDADDIQFALARQFGYPYLFEGDGQVSTELVAAYQPFSQQAEILRALRTQLKLRWFTGVPTQKMLAVVSTAHRDGRSFLLANLAVEFSQLGERTLLIDADLRCPRQHALFNIVNRTGLSTVLSGRADAQAIQPISALPDLSVLPSGPVPPNPQELLGRPAFGRFLEQVVREFDVILLDTPPGVAYADGQSIAAKAGAALLVVRQDKTRLTDAARLSADLGQYGVAMVGSVLNGW